MARRLALFIAAGLAAGLAAAWVGVRLLSAPPMPVPTSMPQDPPAAAPAVGADVPPAPVAKPASLADILRLASDFERTLALYQLASRLDMAGIERLLDEAEAEAVEQQSRRDAAVSILYARYADLGPAAALRHILDRGAAADRWLYGVFHVWARSDLDAAVREFEALNANQRAIAAAAIQGARDDLPREERVDLAARLTRLGAAAGDTVVYLASDMHAANDPARAWGQALQQVGQARQVRLGHAVSRWARTDPHAALDAIESAAEIGRQARAGLRTQAVSAWASTEPRAALEWAMAWPDAQRRSMLARAALNSWGKIDPRSAAQWLDAQADAVLRRQALPTLVESYSIHHPEEAVDWLLAQPTDDLSRRVESMFRTLSRKAPERAAGLLARIADADLRKVAEEALVRGWAGVGPDAAMAWLDRRADADPAKREALTSELLMSWAQYDIAGAMRHLDRLADPKTRDGTIVSMILAATRFDTSVAESLFERIETEELRQVAAKALHAHLARTDPARAARYR